MNDFKFDPGLQSESSNESSFYTGAAQSSKVRVLQLKRATETKSKPLVKSRVGKEDTAGNASLNHRISMCSVVFGYAEDELKILLLETDSSNALDMDYGNARLALPGCLATPNHTLENSAREIISGLSGAENFFIEQVYSFGNPGKPASEESNVTVDPWDITVAFFALVKMPESGMQASTFDNGARWYSLNEVSGLSVYQKRIVDKALSTLRFEIRHFPIAFELLPEKFTLAQVQSLYEAISGKKLDKRNFRKKLKALNLIVPAGEKIKNTIARPSELFVFNRDVYSDSHNSIL